MRSLLVGTCGHIDHGKTSLVRALTGTDCDRLPEERQRGITIELGFARLECGETTLHFVDTPGHEGLVHTMVAGAAGIDLALLVVAADEGLMPQTREHLEVVRLLGVPAGVVALTKIDLVEPELAELAAEEIASLLEGSAFAEAPVIGVSATSGQGLAELEAALLEAARTSRRRELPGRPFRMPVDRVFSVAGAGTVVTGSGWWGEVDLADELVVAPSGNKLRLRSIEVHGVAQEKARAGERIALAVVGAGREDLVRGDQLLGAGDWPASELLTVHLELLDEFSELKEGAELELHAAGFRRQARLVRLAAGSLAPGRRCAAQIALAQAVVLFPGDRFVLRRPAPIGTLAGGVVLDTGLTRVKRRDAGELEKRPEPGDPPALLERWIVESGPAGIDAGVLAARLGVLLEAVQAPLGRLLAAGSIRALPGSRRVLATAVIRAVVEAVAAELERRLSELEVSAGIPQRELIQSVLPPEAWSLAGSWLELLEGEGALRLKGGRALPLGSKRHTSAKGSKLLGDVEAIYRRAGFEAPGPLEVARKLKRPSQAVEQVLEVLRVEGRLVCLDGRWWLHRQALDEVVAVLAEWPSKELSVSDFKKRFALSRKLAIPILAWLDEQGVSRRTAPSMRLLLGR